MKRGSEWLRDGARVYRTDTENRQADEIVVQCADGRRTALACEKLAESLCVLLSGRTAGRAPTPRPGQSIYTPRFKKLLDALSMLRTMNGKTQAMRAIVDYIHDWANRQRQGNLQAGAQPVARVTREPGFFDLESLIDDDKWPEGTTELYTAPAPAADQATGRDDFERGYFCAVSVALHEDGDTTLVHSLFRQGGDPTKADPLDIERFTEHGLMARATDTRKEES